MTRTRLSRLVFTAALAGIAGLPFTPPVATAATAPPTASSTAAPSTFTAPTNLRVRDLRPTQVVFEWDHSTGATSGCTFPFPLYSIHVNGTFRGWTVWGSPVGLVAQLRPGTTYKLQVQGHDNCSGAVSPLSEPLFVTTPNR